MPSKHKKNLILTEVPRKGMSLGWRLALYTAAIVILVMGAVTAFQETKNIQYEREQIAEYLRSSLLPLAAGIEDAASMAHIDRDLQKFHQAYLRWGMTSQNVVLHDRNGRVIASSMPSGRQLNELSRVDLPVSNSLFEQGSAVLSVYQDESAFRAHVKDRWLRGILHFVATLGSILIVLQIAIRLLVTSPLDKLLEGIRKTEMGYWGEVADPGGAWEIRWIIWRFQIMGRELEGTVQHLLAAERRSKSAPSSEQFQLAREADGLSGRQSSELSPDVARQQVFGHLLEVCTRLEAVKDPSPSDFKMARDSLEHHALEAEELGDMSLRCRLENASLRVLEPATYHDIKSRLENYTSNWNASLRRGQERLQIVLEKKMIPVVDLQARHKHVAGILTKMRAKGLEFEQIHDLFALRIVVPRESDCYWALGVVHEMFTPVVGRFKDYIAAPKPNGYRSIHSCVEVEEALVVEIQIRSLAMHQSAENGGAAHLGYKKKGLSQEISDLEARTAGGRVMAVVKKLFVKFDLKAKME